MQAGGRPGAEARRLKGWFGAHRYLVLRRLSQALVLALFLAGPWFGAWIVRGNLASSLTLDLLPLTDPLLLLQVLATGHVPAATALIGGLIVLIFYWLVGGRVYCSWVCPINPITDAAEWLRCKLNIKAGAHFSDQTRYWLLGAILLVAAVSGALAWELVNPVAIVYRGLVFVYTGGQTISGLPDSIQGGFFKWEFKGVFPIPTLIMLLVALAGVVVLARTVFGRRIYAISGN